MWSQQALLTASTAVQGASLDSVPHLASIDVLDYHLARLANSRHKGQLRALLGAAIIGVGVGAEQALQEQQQRQQQHLQQLACSRPEPSCS